MKEKQEAFNCEVEHLMPSKPGQHSAGWRRIAYTMMGIRVSELHRCVFTFDDSEGDVENGPNPTVECGDWEIVSEYINCEMTIEEMIEEEVNNVLDGMGLKVVFVVVMLRKAKGHNGSASVECVHGPWHTEAEANDWACAQAADFEKHDIDDFEFHIEEVDSTHPILEAANLDPKFFRKFFI